MYDMATLNGFLRISHGRSYSEGYALPIRLTEIESYIHLFGYVDIDIIQSLDLTFLNFINKTEALPDEPLQEATMDWIDEILEASSK